MIDKRFNRIIDVNDNTYLPFYGAKFDVSELHYGFVKCKLIHSIDDSIVLPDHVYIKTNENDFIWFQPLTYLVNLLIKEDNLIHCGFFIDISAGNTLKIEFTNNDLITNYSDNSSLFKCKIFGPKNIHDFYTGTGYFKDNIPYLKLFHHTLPRFKRLIETSKILKTSKWNIQGTKKLLNINYFYLTCLEKIEKPQDLKQIAMASDGKIHLLKDNYDAPPSIKPEDIGKYKDGVLELEVYRENTMNRNATIDFFVDSTIISSKHLWKHMPHNETVFYEICMPFIYRIGATPDSLLTFDNKTISKQENLKQIDYQVIGLATKFDGLEAPYDEENTDYIFKVEKLNEKTNILNFWFENINSDQFSAKKIENQEFEK